MYWLTKVPLANSWVHAKNEFVFILLKWHVLIDQIKLHAHTHTYTHVHTRTHTYTHTLHTYLLSAFIISSSTTEMTSVENFGLIKPYTVSPNLYGICETLTNSITLTRLSPADDCSWVDQERGLLTLNCGSKDSSLLVKSLACLHV